METPDRVFPGSYDTVQIVTMWWEWEFLRSSKPSLPPLVAVRLQFFSFCDSESSGFQDDCGIGWDMVLGKVKNAVKYLGIGGSYL
jgi:hypothetical protein